MIDKNPPMVSNITMKKRDIYTLTLNFTEMGQPTRKTSFVRQTHREAMRKVRHYRETGDVDGNPLRGWKLDSGWQNPEDLIR